MTRPARRAPALVAAAVLTLAGCKDDLPASVDPSQVDAVEAPDLGACRELTTDDLALASNATRTVDCSAPHTAQTYDVGSLPADMRIATYDDQAVAAFAFSTCSGRFERLLGADESTAMRTILTWAWFRPSEKAWDDGARWYRCDVVGGGAQSASLLNLPADLHDLLAEPDDDWLVCANGKTVDDSVKLPCSQPHDWRAVSTIKLGDAGDPYPGDRASLVTTRDYCSKSVGAWLGYPAGYDFGYTWFHEAQWDAGNRRSVCWARTTH